MDYLNPRTRAARQFIAPYVPLFKARTLAIQPDLPPFVLAALDTLFAAFAHWTAAEATQDAQTRTHAADEKVSPHGRSC